MDHRAKVVVINVDVSTERDIYGKVSSTILSDFNEFKRRNELSYCTMHQSKPVENRIDVVWATTLKYRDRLIDTSKILNTFNSFCNDNQDEYCQITKMTCQEDTYVVEFSVFRTYVIHFH